MQRVLIAGGGIAGLSLAAALGREGVDCEVVERTDRWAPVGAGILLSVNAMAALGRIGAAESMIERGLSLASGGLTDAGGRFLARTNFADLEKDHGPTLVVHRADLHEVLLAAAPAARVSLGTTVASLEDDGAGVDVRLSDGREERFDLVVGADGIRSALRERILGRVEVRYSGYTCWRMVVEAPDDRREFAEMWGDGLRFGIGPLPGKRVYCFAVANAPAGEVDPEEGRVERFRDRFRSFGASVPEILAALRAPDELIHNDLEELAPCPWSKGRAVLIGDAAHAMTPNMGQGAAMALEDSVVLAEELRGGSPVAEGLARFAARREKRVRWVQSQSRRIGRIAQLERRWLCRARNAVMALAPDGAAEGALRRLASQPI